MHLPVLLIPILAGVSLALPGHARYNSTLPSHYPSRTLLPTGSGGNGDGKPSGPKHTTALHPQSTSSGGGSHPGGGSISTVTQTVTSTTFSPCSTPIGTQGGTTYYSTWLTASVWETTTCYTTTVPAPTVTEEPSAPIESNVPGAVGNCIIHPTVTATVTITVTNDQLEGQAPGAIPTRPISGDTGGGGGHCERCETLTYTNTAGHTTTIVIPPFTNQPESTASEVSPSTSTYPTITASTSERPIGTGTHPTHTRNASGYQPSGTASSGGPRESKAWHLAKKFSSK